MEGNPHQVIEGMIIAAYAIGAAEGFIYCRFEYPLAVQNAGWALEQARAYGLLGQNILGSVLSLDIHINRGAGAFICGESTALMASLEGKIGEPRGQAHPHRGKGTLEQPEQPQQCGNLRQRAADHQQRRGTGMRASGPSAARAPRSSRWSAKSTTPGWSKSPWARLSGKSSTTSAAASLEGKKLQGRPNRRTIRRLHPGSLIDLPVDFEKLKEAGSMMGSGGMIVMDNETCMVDVARYFLNFLTQESCGKCIPCRLGVKRMHEIVAGICEGKGKAEDLTRLEELANSIKESSLCGLGKSAPNPVLSTIRYFRREYEAHILEKRCPAKVCKPLITYEIDPDKCTGCGRCRMKCPESAILGAKKECHVIDEEDCLRCGICLENCKFGAIYVDSRGTAEDSDE